jgi:hypothetical protein
MTGGSVNRDDERRPLILDVGPSSYPLTTVHSSVPAICAAAWVHDVGAMSAPPDSPSTDSSDVLPSTSPRSRFLQQPTSQYRESVIAMVPSLKPTAQARGSSVSEEQVHLKPYQSRKNTKSNSTEGSMIHAKLNTEEGIVEEHGATGDLSSRWWAPSPPGMIQEKMRIPDLKADASSSSNWRIQDSRVGSKRWSLPY